MGEKYLKANETGAKAINVEFLAADVVPGTLDERATLIRLTMLFSVTSPVLEMTVDSGATWFSLNSGSPIPIGQLFGFDIPGMDLNDQINFRTPTTGGTTLEIFRVVSVPFT